MARSIIKAVMLVSGAAGLAVGACQVGGTTGTALSVKQAGANGPFVSNCGTDGGGGLGGQFGYNPAILGQGGYAVDGGLDAPPPYCGVREYPLWPYVVPVVDMPPMPSGVGGVIVPGTYRLTEVMNYTDSDTSPCIRPAAPRIQRLVLGPDTGHVIEVDSNYFDWFGTFGYANSGAQIDFSMTCADGSIAHLPYGPFGPFETYTATADGLVLFSPACQYRLTYARVCE
jgi:hypothetical protein